MIDEARIHRTHATLADAKLALYKAAEGQSAATQTLAKARAAALLSDQITGKNEAERDARAHMLLAAQYDVLEQNEAWLRSVRLSYELAALDWEALKVELRWLEVMQHATADAEVPA